MYKFQMQLLANVCKVFATITVAAANVHASDTALVATPSQLKYVRALQLYCSHNAVAANVQVSDAALFRVFSTLL